jgi:sigma-B regulation protein RsbU (phosphoserine phosphatase)
MPACIDLLTVNFRTSIVLLQMVCVVIVITYLIMRSGYFTDFQQGHLTGKSSILMILLFGAISIYGTESGVSFFGAQINIRDLGPIAAGLTCGPVVGIGAGLIGGLYRYTALGGISQLACTIATICAGMLSGIIYLLNKKRFIGITWAVIFAGCMEAIHMGFVLLLSRPYDIALELVKTVSLPMILANMTGIAVFSFIYQNMIHEREMREERDRIRSDLERKHAELTIARDIQLSFLPENVPKVQGFGIAPVSKPAREVGGDFYDIIIPISRDKIGILIADVSGKGVPAALFMALSRTITRANATWHKSAVGVITETNSMICSDSRSGMFVTLFFGVINPDQRTITYVNAGHNPPLLFRRDGTREELTLTGPALGVIDEVTYTEETVSLDMGDILVMYTDGVTEAINGANEEFGVDRLDAVIREAADESAETIRDRILTGIARYTEGQEQFDDITIIVMKGEEKDADTSG